jgi:hypothetical protein
MFHKTHMISISFYDTQNRYYEIFDEKYKMKDYFMEFIFSNKWLTCTFV